jgi:hypothetical protein
MAAGGFTRVINYNQLNGTGSQVLHYLSHAEAAGMQVILSLTKITEASNGKGIPLGSQSFSSMSGGLPRECMIESPPCSTAAEFLRYVVILTKNSPGLWGYYLADEPSTDASTVRDICNSYAAIRAADSAHPVLLVAQSAHALSPFSGCFTVGGVDAYSYGGSDMDGSAILPLASELHRYGLTNSVATMLVLQADGRLNWNSRCSAGRYGSCEYPPPLSVLRNEKSFALEGDPTVSMMFWYSYNGILDDQRNPSHDNVTAAESWANLSAAARYQGGAPFSAVALENLIHNGVLSNNAEGWTLTGGMKVSPDGGHGGSAAFEYIGTGSPAHWPGAASQSIPVLPGVTYRMSGWLNNGASRSTNPQLAFYLLDQRNRYIGGIYQFGEDSRNSMEYTVPTDGSVTEVHLFATVQNSTVADGASVFLSLPRFEVVKERR